MYHPSDQHSYCGDSRMNTKRGGLDLAAFGSLEPIDVLRRVQRI